MLNDNVKISGRQFKRQKIMLLNYFQWLVYFNINFGFAKLILRYLFRKYEHALNFAENYMLSFPIFVLLSIARGRKAVNHVQCIYTDGSAVACRRVVVGNLHVKQIPCCL